MQTRLHKPSVVRARAEKLCKVCRRSCNGPDPTDENRKLKRAYEKDAKICPVTDLEQVAGQVDHYCFKDAL